MRTDAVLGKVNPWVFGNNMLGYQRTAWQHGNPDYADRGSGIWDPDTRRSVPEMVALAKNMGLSVARYPGGCGVHLFDWKKTVGPTDKRPEQRFGLPEFLRNCRDIGAEPLITLADYSGTANDAADLVAYLNAPDDGRHPWAKNRAADGHPAPWDVVWFEYGNETEHGDHHGQKMTAQEYARRYLEYRRAMRAIDPRINLGAVIATGFPDLEQWPRQVCEIVGKEMDFAIHHSYKPAYDRNDGKPDGATLLSIGLAGADQIQRYYENMRAMFRVATGRDDIPIAVTEFNGHFVQERPAPYRHCLGNALINAEMLRVFLRPENRIVMANFWQFANEYWGAVKGYTHRGDPLIKRPQYYPFELYHNHFGTELIDVSVRCDTYETDGGHGVAPARGAGSRFEPLSEPAPVPGPWTIVPERFPAVPYLSVAASRGPDARAISLMIVNKRMDAPVTASIHLAGFVPNRARAWVLHGPSPDATNERDPHTVTVRERDLGAVKDGFEVAFPPHSLTALRVE